MEPEWNTQEGIMKKVFILLMTTLSFMNPPQTEAFSEMALYRNILIQMPEPGTILLLGLGLVGLGIMLRKKIKK